MGAKAIIIESRLPKPPTSRIMPFHVANQIIDLAPQGCRRRRMPRSSPAEREMRLISPLQVCILQEPVEQHTVFFRCHDQRRRLIRHEFGHR